MDPSIISSQQMPPMNMFPQIRTPINPMSPQRGMAPSIQLIVNQPRAPGPAMVPTQIMANLNSRQMAGMNKSGSKNISKRPERQIYNPGSRSQASSKIAENALKSVLKIGRNPGSPFESPSASNNSSKRSTPTAQVDGNATEANRPREVKENVERLPIGPPDITTKGFVKIFTRSPKQDGNLQETSLKESKCHENSSELSDDSHSSCDVSSSNEGETYSDENSDMERPNSVPQQETEFPAWLPKPTDEELARNAAMGPEDAAEAILKLFNNSEKLAAEWKEKEEAKKRLENASKPLNLTSEKDLLNGKGLDGFDKFSEFDLKIATEQQVAGAGDTAGTKKDEKKTAPRRKMAANFGGMKK